MIGKFEYVLTGEASGWVTIFCVATVIIALVLFALWLRRRRST